MLADFTMPETFHIGAGQRPPVDATSYRNAMANMAQQACLVTAAQDGERLGRTVTSVFSLSLQPPSILVSIDMISPLVDLITRSGGFSFAVLAAAQQAVADAFAGQVAHEERFGVARWLTWNSGHPKLLGSLVTADCEVIGSMETGAHVLFAGKVCDLEVVPDRQPLVWHQRQYRTIADPEAAALQLACGRE
jgi:flavin reductase (DIM6/NTAB) family NADH-FMN oxidoreductase RutF